MTVPLTPLRRRLFHAPVVLYHWGFSRVLGHRFMLLIHIGRRTGRRRETVLEVMEYRPEGPEIVVMSGFGRHPDWLRNIEATRGEEVVTGRDHFVATHRILDAEEAVRVVARYERRNRLIAPIVRLGLTWLLGTRYNGSDGDRRKLVTQLPLIEFRPQS
jgi:deazaflavin-dependent oxidoreductase (nitroreductase family)